MAHVTRHVRMTERLPNGRFPRGNGPGWGGPAKGPGGARPKAIAKLPRTAAWVDGLLKSADREIQAEVVKDEMFRIAINSDDDNVKVSAGKAFLDRVEGTPVARQLTITADATQAAIDRPPVETREEWLARKERERVVTATRAAS